MRASMVMDRRYERDTQSGFGLVELLIALTLGLVLVLGVVQVFLASKQTYVVQRAVAAQQEDARFVLSRMATELRMINMFGCLDLASLPPSARASIPAAFSNPVQFATPTGGVPTLTIIAADPSPEIFTVDTARSAASYGATWLIATDCRSVGSFRIASSGDLTLRPGEIAIPIRQLEYRVSGNALQARAGGAGTFQTLFDGVVGLDLAFGLAATATERDVSGAYVSSIAAGANDRIRSIRVGLRLSDNPANPDAARVATQSFSKVVALRNRVP